MSRSIPVPLLAQFTSLFVDERSRYHRRLIGAKPFARQDSYLSDGVLARHLAGDAYWVAVLRAPESRILSLDLDAKHAEIQGGDPHDDMLRRYQLLRTAMPEPVVLQSSSSGGLHCYWWMNQPLSTKDIILRFRTLLAGLGLEDKNGFIEVKPTTGLCLRLPLGRASFLCDPETLEPIRGVSDDLGRSIEHITQRRTEYAAGDVLPNVSPAAKRRCRQSNQEFCPPQGDHADDPGSTASPLRERVRNLLDDGISGPGQFHAAQRDIAFYCHQQGYSRSECEVELRSFLFGGKHQHHSKTLQNKEIAWREVLNTIKSTYAAPLQRPWMPLSQREARLLWSSTEDLDGVERYHQLLFHFALVRLFKRVGALELPIPKKTLIHMQGAHTGSYQRRVKWAEDHGLVKQTSGYSSGRCRLYRLCVGLDGDGLFETLADYAITQDLSFLTPYMREQVRLRSGVNSSRSLSQSDRPISKEESYLYYREKDQILCYSILGLKKKRPTGPRAPRVEVKPEDLQLGDPNISLDDLIAEALAGRHVGEPVEEVNDPPMLPKFEATSQGSSPNGPNDAAQSVAVTINGLASATDAVLSPLVRTNGVTCLPLTQRRIGRRRFRSNGEEGAYRYARPPPHAPDDPVGPPTVRQRPQKRTSAARPDEID